MVSPCSQKSVVLDPFMGSGTILFESARRSLRCYGADIHPAAVIMASSVQFANMERSQRAKYLHSAQALLERYLPPPQFGGLFWELDQIALLDAPQTDDALHALLAEAKEKAEPLFYILANVVIQALTSDIAGGTNAFLRAFQQQKALIE